MSIPNYVEKKFVDKDGSLIDGWNLFFNQLINELKRILSNEGIEVPQQPASSIAMLTKSANGTVVFDSTNQVLKVSINGVWHIISMLA